MHRDFLAESGLRTGGTLDATDEECIAAAELANADGFIRRLPDGYRPC